MSNHKPALHVYLITMSLAAILPLSVLAFAGSTAYIWMQARRHITELANVGLDEIKKDLLQFHHSVAADVSFLVAAYPDQEIHHTVEGDAATRQHNRITSLFHALLDSRPIYTQAVFATADGMESAVVHRPGVESRIVPPGQFLDISDHDYFEEAARLGPGELYVSPLSFSAGRANPDGVRRPEMKFSMAAYDDRSRLQGVIVLTARMDFLAQAPAMEWALRQRGGFWFLTDQQGVYLYDSRRHSSAQGPENIDHTVGLASDFPDLYTNILEGGDFDVSTTDGRWLLLARQCPLWDRPDQFLVLGRAVPFTSTLRSAVAAGRGLLLLVVGALLLAVLLAWFSARRISRPIRVLSAAAMGYREGRLDARIAPGGPREIGALAEIFNDMAEALLARQRTLEEKVAARTRELQHSEESLAITLNSIGDAVLATDVEGRITRMNTVAETLIGWPREDALGRPVGEVFRIINEHTRRPAEIPVEAVLTSGAIQGLANHTVLIARDGAERPIADSAAPIRDAQGAIFGVVLVFRDVSEERKAENALRQSAEEIRDLYNNAPCGYHSLDGDGVFVAINDTELNWLGYAREEIVGVKKFNDLITAESRLVFAENFPKFKARGWIKDLQFDMIRKDGSLMPVLLNATAIKDDQGNFLASRSTIVDIADRLHAEAEAHRAREEAENANRAKSAFLANMSHEIRTPLNAILGFANILRRDETLSQGQREHLDIINRSGEHLLAIINDILEMARIEAGQLVVTPTTFDLYAFLTDLEHMFRVRTEPKGLKLLFEIDESAPRYVTTDVGKLRQLFINLIGNAVKFTDHGGIAVRVRGLLDYSERSEDADKVRIAAEIEDSGLGIPEKDQQRIFQSFAQAASGARAGGTGLGLAISREFAHALGGDISFTSQEGKGSCFRFDIQARRARAEDAPQESDTGRVVGLKEDGDAPRILIVDDKADNRALIRELLQPVGFDVKEAVNGKEAVALSGQWAPHAILMDMLMPVMDGYEATRRIRATEQGRDMAIIAVTASPFSDRQAQAIEAGADTYLRKPFREEELFDVLGQSLHIEYKYAEGNANMIAPPMDVLLSPEKLAALPMTLIDNLRAALASGDMMRFHELLGELSEHDNAVACGLRALADQYDYDGLGQLLGKGED